MQLYTFSGTNVLLGLVGLCLVIMAGILLVKNHLTTAEASTPAKGKPKASVFSLRPAVHRFSLCAALFASFLVLNWTQFEDPPTYVQAPIEIDETIEQVPITRHRPPEPPPPPPPPVIEPMPDGEAPSIEQVDQSITEEDSFFAEEPVLLPVEKSVPPPPPMPPPREENSNAIVITADHMPVFGEKCLSLTGQERKSCSDRSLIEFVAKQIKYPRLASDNGIEGTVFVRFVVEKDGSVSGIEALREVGGGCTQEALRAIAQINLKGRSFRPGLQAGRPVRVMYNMPVKFQLNR